MVIYVTLLASRATTMAYAALYVHAEFLLRTGGPERLQEKEQSSETTTRDCENEIRYARQFQVSSSHT